MLLLVTFNAYVSPGQERQAPLRQISVLGSVELREIADQAKFNVSVKGVGASLRAAVEAAKNKTSTVTSKLVTLGIPGHKIATSQFYTGDNAGDKAFLSSSRDYQATLNTMVTIDSLPLLEAILYATSESDIQSISNISFSLTNEVGIRKRARVAAAMKAREKADDIANALSVSLGQVISIDEIEPTRVFALQSVTGYPNPFNSSTLPGTMRGETSVIDESGGSGLFAQTIVVTSQVRVVYELKEPR